MRKLILIVSILYPLGCAVAQRTIPKDDAAPPAPAAGNRPAASVDEVIGFYTNRREAALAAFRVGYDAAKSHKTSRAIDMFLEAVHRDPGFVKALYNLAVECAVDERWQDAKQFYETLHQREDLDAQMAGLVSAESRRVNAILDFESTAGGRQRRQFLIERCFWFWRWFWRRLRDGLLGWRRQRFDRKGNALCLRIDAQYLDLDDLSCLDCLGRVLDITVR